MYRKSSRFNAALILSALVLVMILLSGCVASEPSTPKPPCDLPASDRHRIVRDAAISYICSRYPEQNMPSDYRETKSSMNWASDPAIYTSGDWTVSVLCSGSPCQVIVTNEVTGFGWEGDVYWSGGNMDHTLCRYTPEKADRVSEKSATVPPPNAPRRTRVPTPTKTAAERSKIFLNGIVPRVAFSPDSKTLGWSIIRPGQTIILWDVNTHRFLDQPSTGSLSNLDGVAFSPDGKTVASPGDPYSIILWDVNTRRPIGQPLTGHEHAVRNVAFSPDGKVLASGSEDATIILWDVSDVTKPQAIGQPLNGHTSIVETVAFSPDGKTLASASWDKTIILWDVSSRQPIGTPLTRHTRPVFSVAFSPDGKLLASSSEDQTVILWNVSDVASPRVIGQPLKRHTSYVTTVAFSPDGKTLASGSADNTIILWDVATLQPLGSPLSGHTNVVQSVAFSPDGKMLASSSYDKTIILWDVSNPRSPAQILWDVSTPTEPSSTPTRSP